VKIGSDLLPMHLAVQGKSLKFTDTTFCPKTEPKEPKFVDLSTAPPPPEWIREYNDGRHPDRIFTTCVHEGKMVCFYDYSPKVSAQPGLGEFDVHDGNDVAFFGGFDDELYQRK